MKKYFSIITMASCLYLISACSKDNDGAGSGSPIDDQDQARTAFGKINGLWTSTLKPALTKKEQKFNDSTLQGPAGGKAIVKGSYTESRSSTSTSTRISMLVDVTIQFQEYAIDGLQLNGTLRFFDSYNSRTACSSSGCASSTDTHISFDSKNGSGTIFSPITIEFTLNDQRFRDAILLDADKEYSSFDVKLTNGNNKTFSFRY